MGCAIPRRVVLPTRFGDHKDELVVVVHQLYLLIPGCLVEPNDALVVLLPEKKNSNKVTHFHLICLSHTFGKLFSKLLALHVVPRLPELIKENQSSFMLTTKGLHARHIATLMLKVDTAKAFDSVSWPFLLWSRGTPTMATDSPSWSE